MKTIIGFILIAIGGWIVVSYVNLLIIIAGIVMVILGVSLVFSEIVQDNEIIP